MKIFYSPQMVEMTNNNYYVFSFLGLSVLWNNQKFQNGFWRYFVQVWRVPWRPSDLILAVQITT